MTTPKGLSGTISNQTDSGKIRCLTEEADFSPTPIVNAEDTYHNYEMQPFTSFYLCASFDV